MNVKTVYVVFKCHLDVGFTDTQAAVIRRYFDEYLPKALDTAESLRRADGPERYVWTTGSWLISQYLGQATPTQRRRVERAVDAGDLAWHALPFSWETEMLDAPLLEAGLQISAALDRQFGTKTTGAKMTDVPGHTRGLVGPLARAGITFLDVGVNPASTPPDVPTLFRWRDPDGAEVTTLYHRHDYGSAVAVPGTDFAVSINVRGDNTGVHSLEEIESIYAELERQFPGAALIGANLNTVAEALAPHSESLPVVTQEIGDTWVHGCASDPVKVARYRELSRLRREWLESGKLRVCDAADRAWLPWLLLTPEHTWGCDTKTVVGDYGIYTPQDLAAARGRPNFQKVERSWAEKRANMDTAVAALPPALATEARTRLARLTPKPPGTDGLTPLAPGEPVQTARFAMALDPATGAIGRLMDRRTGREWASKTHPLALFGYQTFAQADYDRFLRQYLTIQDWWPPQDFGKPGIEKYPLQSRVWHPTLTGAWAGPVDGGHRVVAELKMPAAGVAAPYVAWPGRLAMELTLPDDASDVHMDFQCFDKPANRLPEAMWLSFRPAAPATGGWRLDKTGGLVDPGDVAGHGGRGLHAVVRDVTYQGSEGEFTLQTLDAPLVAPGRMGLLDFNDQLPDMAGGVHVNLFNNVWGTNYVMWLSDDLRFRFVLQV